jgi:hypothetical protein
MIDESFYSRGNDRDSSFEETVGDCNTRESAEASFVGTGQVSGLQEFIAVAPGPSDDVQAAFADEVIPSAAATPIGTDPDPRRNQVAAACHASMAPPCTTIHLPR